MRFYLLLGSIAITLVSCSRNFQAPSPKIPADRFINYYASSLIISQEEKLSGHDSTVTRHRIDSLQRWYKFSQKDVEKTIEYFHGDLNRWKELNLMVTKRIEEIQRKNE
jgi:hypothetical protein